jgi:EAL domain-containing protein (putative c-di-GMP-specific phosphodiesterase class I)
MAHNALSQNLRLHCQPIAALFGSVMYPMAEVLVRRPEEESGYVKRPEFDRSVVREALRRRARGCEIACFSINLSPQTIADAGFPHFYADALDAHGVSADEIVFEIDERDAASAPSSVRRLCAAVGALGSGIAIDGFGRGQGKLASLALPYVQYVKLHASLARCLHTDEAALMRVLEIVRVAADLNVSAIAESVESDEVLARLRAIKVRYAQGFGVCAPQPMDELAELPPVRVAERGGLPDLSVNSVQGDASWAS